MFMIKSFVDYLKTTLSDVSEEFINDFFNFIDYKNINNNSLYINVDNVIKWLNITKQSIKKTLIKSYINNIDYKITKNKSSKKHGGHLKENIFITGDTFKHICMLTHSKNGKKVREYYIAVEKALYKYKDYIINAQEKRIKQIEQGIKPKIYPSRGSIYIFQTSDSNNDNPLYKIGKATKLKKRITQHQSALSHNIEILFYFESDNIDAVETCVKGFLKKDQYRKYKEIYNCNIDVIKQLIEQCDNIGIQRDILKQKISKLKDHNNYYIRFKKEK